ncbi:MAG: VOC family protein [Nitrospiraceae bacterium]
MRAESSAALSQGGTPIHPHISLDVRDVAKSVAFYQKVFGVKPQKQVADYAKFDLKTPALNFSLMSSTEAVSTVDHQGIEVETDEEIAE